MHINFSLKRLKGVAQCAAMSLIGLATIAQPQQTMAATIGLLHDFNTSAGGQTPEGGLLLAADGNFYGTTYTGGANATGTVFQLTPTGQYTVVYNFGTDVAAGTYPECSLVQGPDGAFYGTASGGGQYDAGTVFKLTVAGSPAVGTLTPLHQFDYTHGATPHASLLLGSDGNLYGTTYDGNSMSGGVVFKMTTAGVYSVIRTFNSETSGLNPRCTLVQGPDGVLYGTTTGGGNNGYGTVFAITTTGAVKWTKFFTYQQAATPYEGVVFGPDGALYGTSYSGGAGAGSIYRVTTAGTISNVYGFDVSNGYTPYGQLTLGPDGNLYGTTYYGGESGYGTIFRIDSSSFQYIYTFDGTYGRNVNRNLIFGKDGNIYGLASAGGTNAGGTAFTLDVDIPTISSFTPTAGITGTSITITGTNFNTATAVTINGTPAVFTITNDTHIKATTPAGAAVTGNITVTTPAATATKGTFTFTPKPTITTIAPTLGKAGDSIVINGTYLTGATSVKFGGVAAASYVVNNAAKITAVVPAAAVTGPISVATPGGTATSPVFTFYPTPTITSFTPTSGAVGASVTITGTNFTGASAVNFNGTTATYTVNTATSITTAIPSGATTGKITVTTPGGAATSVANFTVTAPLPPKVTAFAPGSGYPGAMVTISGANYFGTTAVKFNGTAASFIVNSPTQIMTVVPTGATTGFISVTAPGGTGTSTKAFTVLAPAIPTISNFTPATGPIATVVVISGTSLANITSVRFNNVAASFTPISSAQVVAVVPAGATTGKITIKTAAGTATSATNFTVVGAPTVTSFSPNSGKVGSLIIVTGTNFSGANTVTLNGIETNYTISTATLLTMVVPAGATTGKIAVTTSGGTGTSATNFTVLP